MCGVTGTIFTKFLNIDSRVDPFPILEKLKESTYLNYHTIDEVYNFSIKYKSDINFINYFESEKERLAIKEITKTLKLRYASFNNKENHNTKDIDTISYLEGKDKLLDAIWFLDDELSNRYNFVKDYIDQKEKYSRHTLQFFKILNSIINSINIIEMRGRDSLGLCFQIVIDKNVHNIEWLKLNQIEKTHFSKIVDDKIVVHAVYRTFNRIGSLGDNSRIILNNFRHDKIIIDIIKAGLYESISIVAHTRWASVGKVNENNIHPLINIKKPTSITPTILSFVNGDIYNYSEIYNNMVWQDNVAYNLNEENDSIALSYLFSENGSLDSLKDIKIKLKQIVGSITSIVLSDESPNKIFFMKSGSQGLFFGLNDDRIYFASDAYGLVDDCSHVYNLNEDNCFGFLNLASKELGIEINGIIDSYKNRIVDTDYSRLIISSRDVSKKNYEHYLLKEICETKDIVESTLCRYIEHESHLKMLNV